MTETLHLKDCPVCQSRLSITHDKLEDTLTLRPENLPPLARDFLDIVAHYKRVKGLGADWQKLHGSRAIIYAGQLIQASGPLGGAQERCLGLISWLKESGKDFDLVSAPSFFKQYEAALAAKNNSERSRCLLCGESFAGQGDYCPRHSDKA